MELPAQEEGREIVVSTSQVGSEWTSDENITFIPYNNSWKPAVIQRVVTLCIIMVAAIIGNSIILAALTCSRYRIRAGRTSCRVNIFILNLAVGDLTVCFVTMTGELVFAVCGEWVLGEVACKLIVYAEIVALASTVFILLVMSYDRYLAICRPLHIQNSFLRARRTIALAWILALGVAIPQLFIFVQVREGVHPDGKPVFSCRSMGYTAWWQRRLYLSCLTMVILVIPTAMITFCYISIIRVVWQQSKQTAATTHESQVSNFLRKTAANQKQFSRAKVRTIKLTLCIIVAFVACWTPYFVVHNLRIHSHYTFYVPEPVMVFAETIALFNSALNPIVYGCFNLRVKKALRESCCIRRPYPGAELVLGSAHSVFTKATVASDGSSSCAEETFTHTLRRSPSGSSRRRVIYHNRFSGRNLFRNSCFDDQLPLEYGSKRGKNNKNDFQNSEIYELRQRPLLCSSSRL